MKSERLGQLVLVHRNNVMVNSGIRRSVANTAPYSEVIIGGRRRRANKRGTGSFVGVSDELVEVVRSQGVGRDGLD